MKQKAKTSPHSKEAGRMIVEMIDYSMALSVRKGKHALTRGCNCIACVDKRKRILRGESSNWRYRL